MKRLGLAENIWGLHFVDKGTSNIIDGFVQKFSYSSTLKVTSYGFMKSLPFRFTGLVRNRRHSIAFAIEWRLFRINRYIPLIQVKFTLHQDQYLITLINTLELYSTEQLEKLLRIHNGMWPLVVVVGSGPAAWPLCEWPLIVDWHDQAMRVWQKSVAWNDVLVAYQPCYKTVAPWTCVSVFCASWLRWCVWQFSLHPGKPVCFPVVNFMSMEW